ncbi:spermidine/putrescine transport system substrate-binding protein [Kineococcus xinjiangensis]|uniref:Spermidine/putrescine transport system substrate-binding protein n=1 Tax=Kineococcus xinjiangensis TaxID=512762 RepID=A0A2S6IUB4_9ACTN|nr:spermidine/putrescine ABC transporter substrate-binding protein [Kineococcus xinjiangensis]PPK97646.1 spermidine/putrescine transport system substrate-binding protein [Kineococcus xinjiangensis]
MDDINVLADRRGALGRRAVLAGLAGGAAFTLTGCQTGSAPATAPPPEPLQLFSGADPVAAANISAFAGAPWVKIDVYDSSEDMVTKLLDPKRTVKYDVIVASSHYVGDLAAAGLLLPLDRAKLKNFDNLDVAHLGLEFDPENRWSVPKNSGATGFVYDTTVIPRELTSWADFLDAAQHEASGRTSLLEDPLEIGCAVLAARGLDPNTEDVAALRQIQPFLVDVLAPHIAGFDSKIGIGALAADRYALSQCYNGDARKGILKSADPAKWRFVYPKPTANMWMDNWCILAEASQPDVAHAFIDHLLHRDASAEEVRVHGYDTCIGGLRDEVARLDVELPELVFPTEDVRTRATRLKSNQGTSVIAEAVNAMRSKLGR